ncbi:glycerate kinase [Salinibaculum salinum]|uniref:glycerate kinase type-2 family protein n=1 Tax=Salinibaculum salinum TaxID=3131996 RepID=UPI0030ECEABF
MIQNRSEVETTDADSVALDCVEAGIRESLPEHVVRDSMSVTGESLRIAETEYDLDAYSDILVVGGGNASGRLAAELESLLGDRISEGTIVTDAPTETVHIEMVEGSHPVPNEAAVRGTQRILDQVSAAEEDTLIITLISGGGSALLPAPAEDITLSELREVTDTLLRSGATINEINAIRKHISAIKGGNLARAAAPATVVGVVMSDVIGNQLDVIASGPVVPDESTFETALRVLDEYSLSVPDSVRTRLEDGKSGKIPETPKSGDDIFDRVTVHIVADSLTALRAAADTASEHGYEPLVLSSRVRGEAREAAKTHVAIAEEIRASGTPVEPPAVVLSGGETTVTVQGDGEGGPNQEFALSGSVELSEDGIVLCSVDTDGIDGATDACGALVDWETAQPTTEARASLRTNDVYPFLQEKNALLFTGPTGTNVNDLRVLVIEE